MKKSGFLAVALLMMASYGTAQEVNEPQTAPQRRPRPQLYTIPTDAPVLTKQADGSVVVNTSALCTDVKGYKDMTPVTITIKKNVVTAIEALRNNETPRYLDMAKVILQKWVGLKPDKAQALEVDAVTGATFTSKALTENVRRGLKYYQENKSKK